MVLCQQWEVRLRVNLADHVTDECMLVLLQGCILAFVSLRLDWAAEAKRATALVHETPQPLEDAEARLPSVLSSCQQNLLKGP